MASYIFIVSPVDVHLSQAEEGQDEVDGGELGGLVVILERLVVVLLSWKNNIIQQVVVVDYIHVKVGYE